ncbi:hypothetical protein [Shewanella woodyi]|uniref:DUF7933 domain-containing protein n=1 Tax=Shewanella woodyi TaxID=60961 RepID=UPI0037495AFD
MKYTFNKLKSLLDCSALVFCIGATFFGSQTFAAGTDLTLSGSFSSPTIASGHISTLTYTLTNTSGTSASDIGFTATLPSGYSIAEQAQAFSNCSDGTFTAVGGVVFLLRQVIDLEQGKVVHSCLMSLLLLMALLQL